MRVPVSVHESCGLEQLPGKGLDVARRETDKFVLLDDVVKGWTQLLEHQDEVTAVVETLDVADQMVLVVGVSATQSFQD